MAEHAMYFADERAQRMYKIRTIVLKSLVYLFLTIFALFMVIPFVVMVVGSFIDAKSFDKFENTANFAYLGFANWSVSNYQTIFTYDSGRFPVFSLIHLSSLSDQQPSLLLQRSWQLSPLRD